MGPPRRPPGAPLPRHAGPAAQPPAGPLPGRPGGALAAGATDWPLTVRLPRRPSTIATPQPGDEDLVMLACRRTTFEWVLRRTVLGAPARLAARRRRRRRPADGARRRRRPACTRPHRRPAGDVRRRPGRRRQRPARRRAGVARRASASTSTRRSRTPASSTCRASTGLRDGADVPPRGRADRRRPRLPQVRDVHRRQPHVLGHVRDAGRRRRAPRRVARPGDVRTRRGRRCRRPAVGRQSRAEPITPRARDGQAAQPAATLHRRRGSRRWCAASHAVGDAHTCTNPLYGRGCSLAMVQATLLADAVARHGDDLRRGGAFDYERHPARRSSRGTTPP